MKIKFIKSPAKFGLAYFVGDEAEFEEKQAKSLIEAKYAVAVEQTKPKKGKTTEAE